MLSPVLEHGGQAVQCGGVQGLGVQIAELCNNSFDFAQRTIGLVSQVRLDVSGIPDRNSSDWDAMPHWRCTWLLPVPPEGHGRGSGRVILKIASRRIAFALIDLEFEAN